jgi:hypothetical protein
MSQSGITDFSKNKMTDQAGSAVPLDILPRAGRRASKSTSQLIKSTQFDIDESRPKEDPLIRGG